MGHTIYLPVVPRLGLTTEQRAKAISRELFNLTLPKHLQSAGQTSTMLLSCIEHPTTGEWAVVAGTEQQIKVHPQRDVTALVALFPQLTEQERSQLTYHIATNTVVVFGDLIPSDATTLDEAEAKAAGWFPDDPTP